MSDLKQRQKNTAIKEKNLEQGYTNQSKVYLCLKQHGEYSVKELAQKLRMNEVAVRLAIQGLRLKKVIDFRPAKYFVI